MSLLEDIIGRGSRASQPAATAVPVGTLYYVTDEFVLERSTGAVWQDYNNLDILNLEGYPGGTSDFLRADGSFAAAGGAGSVSKTVVDVTDAEMKGLNTTPKELIPAPGAGIRLVVIYWFMQINKAAGAYSAAVDFHIKYANSAVQLSSLSPTLTSTAAWWGMTQANSLNAAIGTTDVSNQAIQLKSSADITLGNAANSGRVTIFHSSTDAI